MRSRSPTSCKRAPALGGVRLDLPLRHLGSLRDRPLELVLDPPHRGALMLLEGLDFGRVRRESGLVRLERFGLLADQRLEPDLELLLGPLEVCAPGRKPLLEPVLGLGDSLRQLGASGVCPPDDLGARLLAQLPFLTRDQVARLRSLTG